MFTDRASRAGLPRPRLPLSLGLPALLLVALPAALAATSRTTPATRAAAAKARAKAPIIAPGPDAIMPVSQLKPGMKGYGLTVFKGTKVERFEVEILGVLPAANFGKPLVLIRMSGGPITSRGAFLIQGMSGSPVYVNEKLVGAFAYGNAFPKEPIGMVTPIGDMMEALDERLPAQPAGMASADLELPPAVAAAASQSASAGPFDRLFLRPDPEALPLGGSGLGMAPLTTPVMVSGFSARTLGALQGVLRPFNMSAQTGAGRMVKTVDPAPSLTPGAGIGVSLMTGDMDMTAVGTVTWRKDNRILAFGHPFMQIGASNFPVSTVWVHDVFSSFQVAFKIASPMKTVGTLMHDRPFSVFAKAGPAPEMVPVTCRIDDQITKQKRLFKVQVANHPLLLGQLASIAVGEAVMEAHPVPGDVTADVKLALDTEQFGKLQRENTVFDPVQIDGAATQELTQMMSLLSMNSLRRVPVKSLDVDVTLVRRRPTATIERIFVKQERFEPGETAEVGVVIRPYRSEPVTTRTTIRIPDSAASGRAVLMVSGGMTRVDGLLLGASGGSGGMGFGPPSAAASAGATNVAQLLRKFLERERNNQLATRIIYPSMAVSVDGIKLSQLPSPLVEVMRSTRATGVRVEREETKSVEDTEYVLQGVQALSVLIQRKDVSEKGGDVPGISLPGAGLSGAIGLPSGAGLPGRAELAEESLEAFLRTPVRPEEFATPLFRLTPEDEKKPAPPAATPVAPAAPAAPAGPAAEPKPDAPKTEPGKDAKKPEEVKIDNVVLGRQPVTWKQTSLADFQRGTFSGTAVTAGGEVVLSAGLKPLFDANEQFVWSVVTRGEYVYAGTGNSGLVYQIGEDGKASVFCSTGELEVHALAKDASGNLYAATSPCGKVVRISPDGKTKDLICLNEGASEKETVSGPQFVAKYVLSLAVAPDGTVYAGTGPDGKLYRIGTDGRPEVILTAKDKSIVSLMLGTHGEVYAGTADGAYLYRVEPDGKAKVIFDSDQQAITGIAKDDEGNLYAATAPKGTVYRIRPDGTVVTHFDRAKGAINALSVGKDGAVYAACGNVIYRIETPENVTAIADSKRAQFMAIAWDDKGRLIAGSANVAAVYRADPVTEGTFESTVHDAKTIARWGRLRSVALLSPGGELRYETRSGNTPQPDTTWSDWSAPRADATGSYVISPAARYLQYRVTLRSAQGYAVLKEMAFFYMPRNEAPTLTVSAPVGGELWRGPQSIKWAGADPNKDTLTYEVHFSPDMGRTWLPVGEKLVTSSPAAASAPGAEKAPAAPMMTEKALLEAQLARHREELALQPNLNDETRRELIAQAETLVAAYNEQNPGAAAPKPPAKAEEKPAEKKPAVPAKPGVTREQTISWDTTQVPDGVYLLKVVATDRASNPSEPLSIEKVSEPVIVVNQAPMVLMLMPAIQVTAEKQAVVTGLCHSRVALKGAQFRVDEGEWTAIDTLDGIWDSGLEQWRLVTDALKPGEYTLQVKTVDAAGNIGMTQTKLVVP